MATLPPIIAALPDSLHYTFGLRGFPGRTFQLQHSKCYQSPDNGLQLVVGVVPDNGGIATDFSRTTLPELLLQLAPLPDAELDTE